MKTIPQRSVKSNSCQVQVISLKHLGLKEVICRDGMSLKLFYVFYLLCDRRHQIKWFQCLAIQASYIRPRADQGYSVILEEDGEREHVFVIDLDVFSHLLCEKL